MFQEQCKLVADIVRLLDSCLDFSVKSSIFCKYVTEVLEPGHLLELSAVDVEFVGCSVHLHCLGLAPNSFIYNENITAGKTAIANTFNSYFTNIGQNTKFHK